jgi:hypothetical protein
MYGFNAVTNIKLPCNNELIRRIFGIIKSTHRIANNAQACPNKVALFSALAIVTGLYTFNLNYPNIPPLVTVT